MRDLLSLIRWMLLGLFRSKTSLEAEILALRHQLNVLRRASPQRPVFSNFDRVIFVCLYRIAPRILDTVTIVEPETVIRYVALGKRGRWRSNVWTYPGASSLGSDARRGLQDHPTVKPTAMLQDALVDLSNRGEVIIEPFGGSGSTLIACEKTGRICRAIELDPLYVDVIVRRYQEVTGQRVRLDRSGEAFDELEKRRSGEGSK